MATSKIKKGDTVKVIAGKDKGKEGKVLSVNAKNHTAIRLQSMQSQVRLTHRVVSFSRLLLSIFQTLCT